MAAKSTLQIIIDAVTGGAVKGIDKVDNELSNLNKTAKIGKTTWTELSSAFNLASQVMGGLKNFINDTAGATLEYANNVRALKTAIGATPEEASKLIQVADDMGVSFQQLNSALEAGIRKGIKPTIENLGAMSDAYLKLNPGVERSEYLMANFGRTGTDLARIMELGSKKIGEMGDEIEGTARLMDQDALDAAEDYRLALDSLSDSVEDVKLGIGRGLIPELQKAADWMTRNTRVTQILNAAEDAELITTWERTRAGSFLFGSQEANMKQVEEIEKKLKAYNLRMSDAAKSSRGYAEAVGESTDAMKELSDATAIAAGIEGDFADVTAEAAKQLMFKKASADLDAAATRRLAEAMGIWSQESFDVITGLENIRAKLDAGKITSDQYTNSVKNFTAAWNALNSLGQVKDFMIRVALETSERVAAWGGETNPYAPKTTPKGGPKAAGGNVFAGISYPVGERGVEMFTPTTNGYITPNHALGGGDTYLNVTINTLPGMDPQQVASAVIAQLSRNSGRNRAGLGYAGA